MIVQNFNHGLLTILESLACLSKGLLFLYGKCCKYHCLQFIFGFSQSWVGLLLNGVPHIRLKGITDVTGDDVAEIFSFNTGISCLCNIVQIPFTWRRVFQQPPSRSRGELTPPDTWCKPPCWVAQSAGAVEYTDCTSAEVRHPNECPRYGTKQSDGEVPVMLESGKCRVLLQCHRSQFHSGLEW